VSSIHSKARRDIEEVVHLATNQFDRNLALRDKGFKWHECMGHQEQIEMWGTRSLKWDTPSCGVCAAPVVSQALHAKMSKEFMAQVGMEGAGYILMCGRCAWSRYSMPRCLDPSHVPKVVTIYSGFSQYWKGIVL
jgi:hypothetical protein